MRELYLTKYEGDFVDKNEISRIVNFEGVETIEILRVSRVGRKWQPIEAQTPNLNVG